MPRFIAFAAAALAVLAGPAQASGPSFDCSKADGSAEEAVCASDALAAMDVELARLFALAIGGPNMTDNGAATLRAEQRGWIKGRDECWKSDLGVESCVANAYAIRIHDLRQGYADARSEEGASLGPFAYVCEGLDAPVSAVFVNTLEPMAVLRWYDTTLVLPRAPSGSGAKYESDAWPGGTATFWTKGDTALLTPPGGADLSCRQDDIG